MRVAATDYDGTLFLSGAVHADTLAVIRQWRKAGNVFGIVTGRDRSMIQAEIPRWDIPLDFLICCTGAVLYNAEFKTLARQDVPDGLVRAVLEHPAAQTSMHYQLIANGSSHLYFRSARSWFPRLGSPYTQISLDKALSMKGLQQISLAYESEEEGKAYSAMLNEAFGDQLQAHQNKGCIDMTRQGVSKASGIEDALARNNWPEQGILVIGDSGNDLPMIRRFKGFAVNGADEAVRREAREVFPDVGALLRQHL